MDEMTSTVQPAGTDARQTERWQAVVDILYLLQTTWLYVFSLVYPLVGIFFGILLTVGSLTAKGKKIGRICLILGIINTVLAILLLAAMLVLGLTGALTGLLES